MEQKTPTPLNKNKIYFTTKKQNQTEIDFHLQKTPTPLNILYDKKTEPNRDFHQT
jgi:hypothetical protein